MVEWRGGYESLTFRLNKSISGSMGEIFNCVSQFGSKVGWKEKVSLDFPHHHHHQPPRTYPAGQGSF
jgi:hypothetical protein